MFLSLIKFFLEPFNIFCLLILICIGAWYFKKEYLFKWLFISSGIWFLLISTPLLSGTVINSLEDQYTPIYVENLPDWRTEYHIVVLGGGHGYDDRLPANALLSRNALGRLVEGIRLHRQLPNSKVVLSGYSTDPNRTTQAEMLKETALLLGVSEQSTIIQKKPGNTYEEAKAYAKKFGNKHPVILVTSAAHMPRAMQSFQQNGIEPFASPTNYRLKGSWKRKWIGFPSITNIENLTTGIYEYAGIIWYRL